MPRKPIDKTGLTGADQLAKKLLADRLADHDKHEEILDITDQVFSSCVGEAEAERQLRKQFGFPAAVPIVVDFLNLPKRGSAEDAAVKAQRRIYDEFRGWCSTIAGELHLPDPHTYTQLRNVYRVHLLSGGTPYIFDSPTVTPIMEAPAVIAETPKRESSPGKNSGVRSRDPELVKLENLLGEMKAAGLTQLEMCMRLDANNVPRPEGAKWRNQTWRAAYISKQWGRAVKTWLSKHS